jgi:hypothetical protein
MTIPWLGIMSKWVTRKGRFRRRRISDGRPIYWRSWLEHLEKREVLTTYSVINTNDSGPGSFRQAILDANAHVNSPPGVPDVIDFNIPGAGVQKIQVLSNLPAISDPVTIDGTTQPGYAASPLIEVDGSLAGSNVDGMDISAGATGSTLLALAIDNFSSTGVSISVDGIFLGGNYIGIDPSNGSSAQANSIGIFLSSANNTIGAGSVADRNVISGNNLDGIAISGSNNLVVNNYVGTDAGASFAVPNGQFGIDITDFLGSGTGNNNLIGPGNVISGNAQGGISILETVNPVSGNVIKGNFIGTDATGSIALPNQMRGVIISAVNNTVGGTTSAAGNVISGNAGPGVDIQSSFSTGNLVAGNFIGVNKIGNAAVPNAADGVLISDAPNNFIGSTISGAAPNVISANIGNGINITGSQATGNTVSNNYIGTDATGKLPIGNLIGLWLQASGNTVGGSIPGARNIISGNINSGVMIEGTATTTVTGNLVEGNFVGPDITGSAPIGNPSGIETIFSSGNTIGGFTSTPGTGPGNVISGNTQAGNGAGLYLLGNNDVVEGNLIGLNAAGTAKLGNDGGVDIGGTNNTIGGTMALARNVISGNNNVGIYFFKPAATANVIEDNYIGTSPAGNAALGNSSFGIASYGVGNIIGVPGAGNVVSGNGASGIGDATGSGHNLFQANVVGTDATGMFAIPNAGSGMSLLGNDTIGGTAAGAGNVVSGNALGGIFIAPSSGDLLQGNFIGTNINGTSAVANNGPGIQLEAGVQNTTIGGTTSAARNIISGNSDAGISMTGPGTNANLVEGNYIGINAAGTAALANAKSGIAVLNSGNETIGGTAAGAANVLSGNQTYGLLVNNDSGDLVEGNFAGTNPTGTASLPNGNGGIFFASSMNETIGGTAAGAANVIAGNVGFLAFGLDLGGDSGDLVEGNFIGTNPAGLAGIGNGGGGVIVSFSSNETIGGTVAGAGNVISGTTFSDGVFAESDSGDLFEGNLIGTNPAGTAALPNYFGMNLFDSKNDTIGGTTAAARNIISGNNQTAIDIQYSGSTGNLVEGNYIGTDVTGTLALPNTTNGVLVEKGASGNTIGGTTAGARNVISSNRISGIQIFYSGSTANVVEGNYIGTNAAGTAALGNGIDGVDVGAASGNTIGGTAAGAGNVISGNVQDGIDITSPGTTGNEVEGNFIGTNASGSAAVRNLGDGVHITDASQNTIGGLTAGSGNVISGNQGHGVLVEASTVNTSGIVIEGNFIGTDATGSLPLGNIGSGIFFLIDNPQTLTLSANLIGGTTAGARNIISANQDHGIYLDGVNNVVQGNYIGTDVTGTHGLGNRIDGFAANGTAFTIGGSTAGAGNVISDNGAFGLEIVTANPGSIVEGNFIGTDATGTTAIGNLAGGLAVDQLIGSTIGGTVLGAGNVISGNAFFGITLANSGAANDVFAGNYIGTNAAGTAAVANSGPGIWIFGSTGNLIGGTSVSARNLISGNTGAGVLIDGVVTAGTDATGNVVAGNFIGTDVSGAIALANQGGGVIIESGAFNNTVGGTATAARNIISGNSGDGVQINGTGTSGNVVEGDYIGLDITGAVALRNLANGVTVKLGASNNTIGGTTPGARNVISGNAQDGIHLQDAATRTNAIEGNYLGLDASGTFAIGPSIGAQFGIFIQDSLNTIIGGTTAGAGNVISGNSGAGIITSGTANNTLIQGNLIGTDASGTLGRGNRVFGLDINSSGNTIGGTIAGARNVISGNGNTGLGGVHLGGLNNVFQGNYVGTDITGGLGLGNRVGVLVFGGGNNNTIGGSMSGAGNVISGNLGDGIQIQGVANNLISGNLLGLNAAGTVALANSGNGITITNSTSTTVGGTTSGAGNVISGNKGDGIQLAGSGTTGTVVEGNYIGLDVTGALPLGNLGNGVTVKLGAGNNTIGGTTAGAGNVISGNTSDGVTITDAGTSNNLVAGNFIGTDVSGKVALGNLGNGITVEIGASNNTVGGTTPGARNIISSNAGNGIYLLDGYLFAGNFITRNTANNDFEGNYIGTDVTGSIALGNSNDGFLGSIVQVGETIGGTAAGAGNVVSGNHGNGIVLINSSSNGLVIQGNLIGTNASGTTPLGNLSDGISLNYSGNITVGGTSPGAGNLISGNGIGIFAISDGAHLIQGNQIGSDITGTHLLGHQSTGINLAFASACTIGGTTAAARNVIVGSNNGISIGGNSGLGTLNIIEGNNIGVDASETVALGGSGAGILLAGGANNNTIGGTVAGAGNVIANYQTGIVVGGSASDSTTVGNTIRGNSIYSNTNLGVDLGNDGVTPNRLGSGAGPNNFINFPVLVHAIPGTTTEIVGTYNGLANTLVTIDFYASPMADPSGYGQGKRYLGSTTVTTDNNGNASFDVRNLNTTVAGEYIAATATDPGDTSEFSQDIQADTPPVVNFNAPTSTDVGLTVPLTAKITNLDPTLTYNYQWSLTLNGSPVTLPDPSIVADNPTNEETFIFTPQQVGNYQVFLTVTDSHGGIGTATSGTIAVGGTTIAVVLTGDPVGTLAPVTAATNQFLTLHSQLTDPLVTAAMNKGQQPPAITFQYSWSVSLNGSPFMLPLGTITNADSFTFVPTQGGTYLLSLAVSDGQGGKGAGSTAILVSGAAPAVQIIVAPSVTVPEGTPVTLNTKVTDATLGGQLTYNWTITPNNGQPIITESDTIGTITFNPKEEGQYQVLLSVTDSHGHQGIGSPVLVTATNATPIVTISTMSPFPPLNQLSPWPTGTPITFSGMASDADPKNSNSGSADPYVLTWSVTTFSGGQPSPATGSGANFTFTPNGADLYVVTLTATDEKNLATSTSFVLNVTQVMRTMTVTAPTNPVEGAPLTWVATVTGPSNVAFHYIWKVSAPDNTTATYDSGFTNGGLPNTLSPNNVNILTGYYSVSVTATGSDGSAGSAAPPAPGTSVTVANASPQIILPQPSGPLVEGSPITQTSMISDPGPDLNLPIYAWTVTGPDGFSTPPGVQSSITFVPPEVGTYTVKLKVTDSNNGTSTATTTITVAHLQPQPTLQYAGLNADNSVNLVANIPDPGNDDAFTFAITLNNNPLINTTQSTTSFAFTIPAVISSTVVGVTVTDAEGGNSSATTTILVVPANTTKNLSASDVGSSNEIMALAMGTDTVSAAALSSTVTAVLVCVGSHNTMIGGSGTDDFDGDSSFNLLEGGSGSNTFFGSSSDTLQGGSGTNNFVLRVPNPNITPMSVVAGSGPNTIDLSQQTSGINLNLTTNLAQVLGSSTTLASLSGGFQNVVGSMQADLITAASNMNIFGSGGNDTLQATNVSNVSLIAGGGNSSLSASGGSNLLLQGGIGIDTLTALNVNNAMLFAGSGSNDSLSQTGSTNITLFGGSGSNDSLASGKGSNVSLIGGSGTNDSLSSSGSSNVTIFGGSGSNDSLAAGNGSNVTLIGGSGSNDSLSSNGGSNVTLFGGSGSNDSLAVGNGSNVTLFGGSGSNDTLSSTGGSNVTLFGGSGSNDSLAAGTGSNVTLIGGSGSNDSLSSNGGSNVTLFGGSGSNDSLASQNGSNISLIGGSGSNDSLSSNGASNVTLFGGSGSNDSLAAGNGSNVTLIGGSGSNDSLSCTGGSNVTIFGGSGSNDSLAAGNGSNVTLIGGSGSNDSLASTGGSNVTLIGGSGSNDSLSSTGGSNITLLGGSGSNDSLSSNGSSNVTLFGGSGSNDSLAAGNGANVTLIGGSGSNDSLSSNSSSNVTIFGGSGSNDSLSSNGGSNITLFGGSGSNDSLASQNGSNVSLIGGSGSNDSLSSSGSSNVTLFGGSGSNDSLSSSGGQNVTIFGGSGSNDSLSSSGGQNITLFGGSGSNDSLSSTGGGTNILLIGGSGSNDSLSTSNGTNITLLGGSGSNDSLSSNGGMNVTLFGGSGSNDSLAATNGSNITLVGGSGSNDSLSAGGTSNVLLIGGSGSNDSLSSNNAGNVTFFGGSGSNDSLATSNSTNVTIIGGSGSNDSLSSTGAHNVTLIGGSGSNDSLSSNAGSNVTLYGGSGNNDVLTDISSNNIGIIGGSGSNDSLSCTNGSNVTLFGGSGSNDSLSSNGGINVTLFGGSGNNDTLYSTNTSNITLFGGSGDNDSLYSTLDTNATLIGGSGSGDTLQAVNDDPTTLINGGAGTDFFEIDGGSDVSAFGGFGTDFLTAKGGTNIRLYGEDGNNTFKLEGTAANPLSVSLDDLATIGLEQSPNDRQTRGTNTIEFPTAFGITIDLSQFSQGTTNSLLMQTVATGINVNLVGEFENVVGTPGNDYIKGNGVDNVLQGVSGNDTLVAGSGNSTLEAGSGNDTLIGGTGTTTYLFSGSALGQDIITQANPNNQDTIDLSQLTGGPATIDLTKTTPQTVNPNLTLTLANANTANVIGSPLGNTITGNTRDNQFTLQGGMNSISGGGGFDTYIFTGSQLGNVTINDSAGSTDALNFHQFGQPINIDLNQNTQTIGDGTLSVNCLAVVDVVGSSFNDVIKGNNSPGAPSVSLIGGGGLDSLVAGTGNDFLQVGITQVVLLDFDSFTLLSDHVYSQVERDAIQQRLETIYTDFSTSSAFGNTGIVFTQSLATAQALSKSTGGQFATIYFNRLPEGGLADEVDFRNLDLGGTASVDVNPILGQPGQPPATTANYIQLSANLAAHELGHLLGLRHADSFGPIGSGAYEVFNQSTKQQISGVNPNLYHSALVEPPGVTPVSGNFTPDGGQTNTAASIYASETPLHVMASPASVGISRFDSLANIFFGEREAIKLAFDDTGVKYLEQLTPHQSFATAQGLGSLPSLVVPNKLLSGVNFGQTFNVKALDLLGHIGIDPGTGKSEDDYYSFFGHQGDLMNFEVMSNVLSRIKHPIDSVLKVYDSAGNLLAMNDDEFESQDSTIIDFTLPADGLYYAVVDTYTSDGINDSITGDYELYMYSFATTTGPSQGGGSTLVGGSGHDTMLGGTGNDLFTFQPNSTGSASIMGGGGQDLVDETPAPGEQVTINPAIPPSSITVKKGDVTPPSLSNISPQTVNEGHLLHFTAQATDSDEFDVITYSLANAPSGTFPAGAAINPATGEFNWLAGDEGAYMVRIIATDSSGNSTYQDVSITVSDVLPAINPIPAQTVNEGTAVSLHGSVANPVSSDTYMFSWMVTLGNQTVATGTSPNLTFTPGDEGTYNIQLKVTDIEDGTSNSSIVNTAVTVNDMTPTVGSLPSPTVNEGTPVSFTGSYYDPGTVDSLVLDWHVVANNEQIIPDGTAKTFGFTPNDAGIYTVTFTVQDADGGPQGSATAIVTVNNVAPTAALSNNGPIAEGGTATISFTNVVDFSTDDFATLHYSFALQQNGLANSYGSAGTPSSAAFAGLEEGTYVVYGRIFNEDNSFNDYTTTVSVNDAPISGTGGFIVSATEGATFPSQAVANFTDPGPAEALTDYNAMIAWGDGQVSAGAISFNSNTKVFTVSGNPPHAYSEDGSKSITVTLTHDLLPAVVVTDNATVTDPPLSATGNSTTFTPTEGTDSGTLILATFTDPGGSVENLADYTAQIIWGDGQAGAGSIVYAGGQLTVMGHHIYAEEGSGPYNITVTLGHDNTTPITVTDKASVIDPPLLVAVNTIGVAENSATGLIPIATFTDPGGAESAANYSVTINWGDNNSTIGAQIVPVGDGKSFTVLGNHTYAEEKTYTLTVTVTPDNNQAVQGTGTANVSDPAVVPTATLTNLIQNVNYTNLTVATFVDPAGPEALADYSATINWGDNTPASTGVITVNGGTFAITGSHTYTQIFGSLTLSVALSHESSPTITLLETVVVGASIIVLNPTASGAMTVSGSSIINVKGNVIVDSNSSSALTVGGTSQITAADILVVGGVSITGTPILTPTPTTHAASVPDPFINLPAPSATGLTNQGSASYSTGTHILNPGIYTSISVTNSASVVLNPGTYVIKGGGLTVSGTGSVTGSGVFIYNAGSNYPNSGGNFGAITISNSGSVTLSAATTGTYANILIFQSRDNTKGLSFSGSVVAGLTGEIYASAAALSVSNSAALKNPIVVNRLTVSGSSTGTGGPSSSSPMIAVRISPNSKFHVPNSKYQVAGGSLVIATPAGSNTTATLFWNPLQSTNEGQKKLAYSITGEEGIPTIALPNSSFTDNSLLGTFNEKSVQLGRDLVTDHVIENVLESITTNQVEAGNPTSRSIQPSSAWEIDAIWDTISLSQVLLNKSLK